MIAGRRPSTRASAAKKTEEAEETKDETRSSTARASNEKAPADEASPKKPARRRRSRAKAADAPTAEGKAANHEAVDESAVEAPPAAEDPATQEAASTPRRSTARRSATAADAPASLVARFDQLAAEIAGQHRALMELGAGVDELSTRLDRAARKPRLGVFVDVPNVLYGLEAGEAPLDMGKLLAMLTEGRELVRATAYAPVSDDPREAVERQKFVAPFVPHAYRIVTKPMKRASPTAR